MKISNELYNKIASKIDMAENASMIDRMVKAGCSNERIRWDLFWQLVYSNDRQILNQCYDEGLNDTHIDTALKRITGLK